MAPADLTESWISCSYGTSVHLDKLCRGSPKPGISPSVLTSGLESLPLIQRECFLWFYPGGWGGWRGCRLVALRLKANFQIRDLKYWVQEHHVSIDPCLLSWSPLSQNLLLSGTMSSYVFSHRNPNSCTYLSKWHNGASNGYAGERLMWTLPFARHLTKGREYGFLGLMSSTFWLVCRDVNEILKKKILLEESMAKNKEQFNKFKQKQTGLISLVNPLPPCPPAASL